MSLLLLFQGSTTTAKVWNGSAWISKNLTVWNGSSWVLSKAVRVWNGTAWVDTQK